MRGAKSVLLGLVALVIGAVSMVACNGLHPDDGAFGPHHLVADTSSATPAPAAGPAITGTFRGLTVVADLPDVAGYQRSCRKGKGCVFGPAWSDDTDAAGARNGCDTRNDILRAQLVDVATSTKSRGCKVTAGTLHDPYTGTTIPLATTRSSSSIAIDHVIPLERIWNSGASTWTPRQRATVANDPRNLIATDSALNSSKGSKGLGEWLPPNAAFVCEYTRRYLAVALAYRLPITSADREAVTTHHC